MPALRTEGEDGVKELDPHPDSTISWLQVARGDTAFCFHCDQPVPCAAYLARHDEGDEHREICRFAGCRYRWSRESLTAAAGPGYEDVACHRGEDDHGRAYCVGHGQDWPCAAPTGPEPRTDAAMGR